MRGNKKNEHEIGLLDRFERETNDIIIYANYFPDLKKEILGLINSINSTIFPIIISQSREKELEGSDLEDIRIRTLALSRSFSKVLVKISNEVEKQIQKLEN